MNKILLLIWPEYFPIWYKWCRIQHFHQSQHNRCRVWTTGWCCFAPDCSPPARPAWKRCGGSQEKKEEEQTQKISDPSMAGRGEEEAVWTLRQTDEGAQSRRHTVILQLPQDAACHVWWVGAETGARIEKQDTNMRKALPSGLKLVITVRLVISILPWMTPECFECCWDAVRLLRVQ